LITSHKLWNLLLVQRSPYPLFIRIAPRAHRSPSNSIWQFLTWYTIIGLYLSTLAAPFMFRSILLGILLVVFGSPAFIVVLTALVGFPFVIFGGNFFGLRTADAINRELTTLRLSGFGDLVATTPPGLWGTIRAVSAAHLRRREIFFGAGIYEMIHAHAALSAGFALPIGTLATFWALGEFTPTVTQSEIQPDTVIFATIAVIALPLLIGVLIHLDFRQSLMFGVTAGIFGGTVEPHAGTQTITFVTMLAGTLTSTGIIAVFAALGSLAAPFLYGRLITLITTLIGWGVGLLLRESLLTQLWKSILKREGLSHFNQQENEFR